MPGKTGRSYAARQGRQPCGRLPGPRPRPVDASVADAYIRAVSLLPHDPDERFERRPMGRRTDPHPSPGEPSGADPASLLSRLVDLVTARARDVAGAHSADPEPMERLRESVEALGNVLGALRLVGSAAGLSVPEVSARPAGDARPSVRPPPGWEESGPARLRRQAAAEPPDGGSSRDDAPPGHAPFRDRLTGLLSRDGFDEIAAGELGRSLRHGRALAVARIRLAGGGAPVVLEAAGRLRRGLRASDLVGRDGEYGFLLAFPETGREDVDAIVRRLIGTLREGPGAVAGARVGLATCPEDGNSLDALVESARDRMAARSSPDALPG